MDNLSTEIVLGMVRNRDVAVQWLCYDLAKQLSYYLYFFSITNGHLLFVMGALIL